MSPNAQAPLEAKPLESADRAFSDWIDVQLDAPLPDSKAAAMFDRGVAYWKGQGEQKDLTLAAHWFKKAAEKGYDEGQFLIGFMYSEGLGVPQNYAEAVQWHLKAAAQGHAGAQRSLGEKHVNGHGLPQDFTKAVEWFLKAAASADEIGQYNLGVMYANGEGVAQDNVQAHKWFDLAATRAIESDTELRDMAIEGRNLVASKMSSAQIAEAQRLASEWLPG